MRMHCNQPYSLHLQMVYKARMGGHVFAGCRGGCESLPEARDCSGPRSALLGILLAAQMLGQLRRETPGHIRRQGLQPGSISLSPACLGGAVAWPMIRLGPWLLALGMLVLLLRWHPLLRRTWGGSAFPNMLICRSTAAIRNEMLDWVHWPAICMQVLINSTT